MKKLIITLCLASIINVANADVNAAVETFFRGITPDVNVPDITRDQSAGVISGGGFSTRSQVVNLNVAQLNPPSFSASCGNINFYSGSMSFMTNTDQIMGFLQNVIMTAGVTAGMTALKAVTPNIAGTVQSMFDAAQKMLNMFNNSCQLGMATGNWMTDRLSSAKGQAHSDSSDASQAEINSSAGGSSGGGLADSMTKISTKYQNWVNNNAHLNPNDGDGVMTTIANRYGSVIWKGMQSLHLYSLPDGMVGTNEAVAGIANLVISLTGDVIIYSPNNDGTGIMARAIPPQISIKDFMTTDKQLTMYNCPYFKPDAPGECTGAKVDLRDINYPPIAFNGGVVKYVKTAMIDIQDHFVNNKPLTNDDMIIISISTIPIYAIAQTLDDIGMSGSITSMLNQYSDAISYQILQNLVTLSLNLANQATVARTNPETDRAISALVQNISSLQREVSTQVATHVKTDPVEIIQKLNLLHSYAQNTLSPEIMQKVNFAKQLGSY